MVKKKITPDQHSEKMNKMFELASEGSESKNILKRLGAVVLYAGLVEYLAIQSARLLEQILLKEQLSKGKKPSFPPHDDAFFYDRKVPTRDCVNEIKKYLPFEIPDSAGYSDDMETINDLIKAYMKSANKFLNYRNVIVHQVGDQKKTWSEIEEIVDKAITAYKKMEIDHRLFCKALQPYRFGEKELNYFYGASTSGTLGLG